MENGNPLYFCLNPWTEEPGQPQWMEPQSQTQQGLSMHAAYTHVFIYFDNKIVGIIISNC